MSYPRVFVCDELRMVGEVSRGAEGLLHGSSLFALSRYFFVLFFFTETNLLREAAISDHGLAYAGTYTWYIHGVVGYSFP